MTEPPSSSQRDQVQAVMIDAARTQMAAITAGISFWSGWVDAADRYATSLSAELASLEGGAGGPSDLTGRLTDLTRAYLRELTDLPAAAVKRFNTEMERIDTSPLKPEARAKPAPRKRAVRAKL